MSLFVLGPALSVLRKKLGVREFKKKNPPNFDSPSLHMRQVIFEAGTKVQK
jgi:hypothetical protein